MRKWLSCEIVSYLFFGVLTTLVNYAGYYGATRWLNLGVVTATITAWIMAVLFAFVTNKLWVFDSHNTSLCVALRELSAFIACRLFSGVLDVGMMWLFVECLGCPDMVVKLGANGVVVVLNYLFSKWWIFKK